MNPNNLVRQIAQLGDTTESVANIVQGGQLGIGLNPSMLDSATPLVFPPTVLVTVATPGIYDDDPAMQQLLQAVIDVQPKEVSGIDFGYTTDTEDSVVGHDGQTFKAPTQTKRSEVSPSFVYTELSGNIIWKIWNKFQMDIQPADGSFSLIGSNVDRPRISSDYSLSVAMLQFDATGAAASLVDGAFLVNLFPTDTGQIGWQRTIGTSKVPERTITCAAYVIHNKRTKQLCKQIAATLQLNKITLENMEPTFPNIKPSLLSTGLQAEIKEALAE